MKRLLAIDPDLLPKCTVCSKLIPYPFENQINDTLIKRWLERKRCPLSQDTKPIKCSRMHSQESIEIRRAAAKKASLDNSVPRLKPLKLEFVPRSRMSQEEADRLDLEQIAINIACHRRTMERCGYVHSPVRILSPEEIDAIKHTIKPPENVKREFNPHYRPFLPRGSAQV